MEISESRFSLGIMGTQLRALLKPLNTIECCDSPSGSRRVRPVTIVCLGQLYVCCCFIQFRFYILFRTFYSVLGNFIVIYCHTYTHYQCKRIHNILYMLYNIMSLMPTLVSLGQLYAWCWFTHRETFWNLVNSN